MVIAPKAVEPWISCLAYREEIVRCCRFVPLLGSSITILVRLSADRFVAGTLVKLSEAELTTNESYVLLHRPEDQAREDLQAFRQMDLERVSRSLIVADHIHMREIIQLHKISRLSRTWTLLIVQMGRWYLWPSRNTTMQTRIFGLAVITAAALSPSICNASPETDSVNACARAFATSIASPGTAAPSFKLEYHGTADAGSLSAFYRSQYTFDLEAHDPKTGVTVARARCSTDRHSAVIAFTSLPLGDKRATFSAQL
jgi:hypothetical protein